MSHITPMIMHQQTASLLNFYFILLFHVRYGHLFNTLRRLKKSVGYSCILMHLHKIILIAKVSDL